MMMGGGLGGAAGAAMADRNERSRGALYGALTGLGLGAGKNLVGNKLLTGKLMPQAQEVSAKILQHKSGLDLPTSEALGAILGTIPLATLGAGIAGSQAKRSKADKFLDALLGR